MNQQLLFLLVSALSVGAVHTLLGPDHYLPFIVLAKSRNWTMPKTVAVTTLCGIGHVLSAVILGVIAMSVGFVIDEIKYIDSIRGDLAGWMLIIYGFIYLAWGVWMAVKNKKHSHLHMHADGGVHEHAHGHQAAHTHSKPKKSLKELTPWVLFMIFVLGPCGAVIPFVMAPAIQGSMLNVFLVTVFFGLGTLFVMLAMVVSAAYGANKFLRHPWLERYGNAVAGGIICACGLSIQFLGL